MDSYAQLNEEVFKHLCNLAIDKVNDKAQRRKAGCGGVAMRKRLLIKNFVNDLCKKKAEEEFEEGDVQPNEEIEFIECDDANVTLCEDDSDNEEEYDNTHMSSGHSFLRHTDDFWLDTTSDIEVRTAYADIVLSDSMLSGHNDSVGLSENKTSSDLRLSIYDLYSHVSESAIEGGHPPAVPPISTQSDGLLHTVPSTGFQGLYETSASTRYNLDSLSILSPLSSLCDVTDSAPLQPVRAEESDQLFLSLSNHHYSEMKTYSPSRSDSSLQDVIMSPPFYSTLIDFSTQNESKKRKNNEVSLFESISAQMGFQKKIKL